MSDEFKIINSSREDVPITPETKALKSIHQLHFSEVYGSYSDFGEMVFQKVSLSGADLWYSYYHMHRETLFYGVVDHPILEAHTTLQNRYVQSVGRSHDTVFDTGQFNLTCAPFMENKTLFPKDGEYITFDIHPSLALLERLTPDFPHLDTFINTVYKNVQESVSLYQAELYLSPDMNYLIKKILDHLSSEDAKKSYTEVLITELLILLLMRGSSSRLPDWRLKPADIEALHYAREIIIEEAEKYDSEDLYDTSIQLADKVDLSLYKFKTGFKYLFGTSPYKLLVELRLYRAKILLKETSYSILDIALKTGYKSPEGFAKAYKKLFGISPSDERG